MNSFYIKKPHILELALKPHIFDSEGENIRKKAEDYFNIDIKDIRVINIIAIYAALSDDQLTVIAEEIFTNPVTQISSYSPLSIPFDWTTWVGYKAGVKDNRADSAREAIENFLKMEKFGRKESLHTSKRYCITGGELSYKEIRKITAELLVNDIISESKIFHYRDWDPNIGIKDIIPRREEDHKPELSIISTDSVERFKEIAGKRDLAFSEKDIRSIISYFRDEKVLEKRAEYNLADPTDLEIEYIAQARSDHCSHNTFKARYNYFDADTGKSRIIDNLFERYIRKPALRLKEKKDSVISSLWDNAGIGRFDDLHYYAVTGETHNSPSNLEAYGGAITGILGVYRDIIGTGKGAKPIMGSYAFCTGYGDYNGKLKPRLHPRRLLDGIIEGVKDGGNKSGVPTNYGQIIFNDEYIGKSLVFVSALGIIPAEIRKKPSETKNVFPKSLIMMSGGRVGKDGIHGATASSEILTSDTPTGHVQIGDPYTQKKLQDFLIEARDEGLIEYITDNGAGGLSASVGESAAFSGGARVDLAKVPLKYRKLDFWEIWVSESQERMTISILPKHLERFMLLSEKHGVESSLIGEYTDDGAVHVVYKNKTCAYITLDFLESGFSGSEFDAVWISPEKRGLFEPVIREASDYNLLLKDILRRPNIISKESIIRQYDHEVLGGSIIKPLVGKNRDVNSDAVVIRPVLSSYKGIVFAQALLPFYSKIDTYHMTQATVDEAVRRVLAVGGNVRDIGGVDNFCWPDIRYDAKTNPDGRLKAAKLVRSCMALKKICSIYGIPLLSGKDSMYADGKISGEYGEIHKVSAPETLCFSAVSVADDIRKCVTMDVKFPGDIIYLLGDTKNELGGSEYYEMLGYTGLNVPRIDNPKKNLSLYNALFSAVEKGLAASVHGIYRGGLAVHLALCAIGGGLGMEIDLSSLFASLLPEEKRNDILLFSESAGRFIITVDPKKKDALESLFSGLSCFRIGVVTETEDFVIKGFENKEIISLDIADIRASWKKRV